MYHISKVIGYKGSDKLFNILKVQGKGHYGLSNDFWNFCEKVELSQDGVVIGEYFLDDLYGKKDIFGIFSCIDSSGAMSPYCTVYDKYVMRLLDFIEDFRVVDTPTKEVYDKAIKIYVSRIYCCYNFSMPICFCSNNLHLNILGFLQEYIPVEPVTYYRQDWRVYCLKINDLAGFQKFIAKTKLMR